MAPSVRSEVAQESSASLTLANTSTIADLIATIPHTWRASLGNYLSTVYRVASKLCTVQNTIAQYDRHKADGSFPASIQNSLREPKLQFSKEFLGTENGSLAAATLNAVVHSARTSLLESALARKKEELAALQKITSFDKIAWRVKVADIATRTAETFGVKVVGLNTSDKPPHWEGGPVPSDAVKDCEFLWSNGSLFHYRAITLARALADRSLVEKTKSLSLKKETDIAARDKDMELSTRDVVRDEMQAQMRLLKQDLVRSMGQGRKSAPQKKKGGSNPNRVKKGSPSNKKGNGKKNKR